MTNEPLTAEQMDADRKAHQIASRFAIPGGSWALYNEIVAYAAQEVARVTAERDALREVAQGYNLASHTLLTAKEYKKTVRADKQYRLMKDQGWAQLKGAYNKALAQKGGCSHTITIGPIEVEETPDIEFKPDGEYHTAEWPPQKGGE
jgi:hypothetical protein